MLKTDYVNYRKRAYASGGQMSGSQMAGQFDYAAMAGGVSSMADSLDKGNSMGRQKTGTTVLKGAASGAALGSSILPGWGTAVGAVIGAGVGLIAGGAAKRKERKYVSAMQKQYDQQQYTRSEAEIMANPESVTGYDQGATGGYYANGGSLGDPDKMLLDNINTLVARGGNPMNQVRGRLMSPASNSTNTADRQQMLTDVTIFNQRPDVQKMSADERLSTYYMLGSKNPQVKVIKDRLKGNFMGSGPVSYYNSSPQIDKTNPIASLANGGQLTTMSKGSVDVDGPSHTNGGVSLPGNNEVEGGETIDDGYVFSKRLGFADQHRPIAKAIGKIEKKPYTLSSRNSINRMKERVENLKVQQEQLKLALNLQ